MQLLGITGKNLKIINKYKIFYFSYFIKGLLLVCFVIYTQQAAVSTPCLEEQFNFDKRRIDAHSRTSLPLFRGSNLGMFVRKRPFVSLPERSVVGRKEVRSLLNNDENNLAELLDNTERLQRRFDDYSENPGPMFGR
jgi:hypothetical protein